MNNPPSSADLARWNQRYAQDEFVFGTEPNEWLRQQAAVWHSGDRVLCVADGEGRNSVWLAEQGLLVDAFDPSEVGVAKARKLAGERQVNVNFNVADCDSFPWPESSYDGVAAIFIQFADPVLRARLFRKLESCLKPGGTLILQGYTHKQLEYRTGGPSELSHLYDKGLLLRAFGNMEILNLNEYETEVAEGAGHSGLSALIGLVARKQ